MLSANFDSFSPDLGLLSRDRRCFLFSGIEERNAATIFPIKVDLRLLVENRVLVQERAMFCLRLLTAASPSGATCWNEFHSYRAVGDDFRPLIVERERSAAEKTRKKHSRTPARKPSLATNLHLGTLSRRN